MTAERTPDMLGLRASLPAPGWTVLDAARDQRFTGQLVATTDTDAEYRVYFDRGDIYVAERSTDPSLGVRLVEAGAINSAQLEYGTLRIGEIEHLSRLFDRVPSINRDAVLVLNQLMTEETVRSMAGRSVTDVDATPYRHHPSGMHRWSTSDPTGTPPPWGDSPELALPAPAPDARPIVDNDATEPTDAEQPSEQPSEPTDAQRPEQPARDIGTDADAAGSTTDDLHLDDVVEWNEPSQLAASSRSAAAERRALFPSAASLRTTDWIDDLGSDGLADAPAAPAVHAKLPPVAVPAAEQFEVIWPSGEAFDVATSDDTTDDVATINGTATGDTVRDDTATGDTSADDATAPTTPPGDETDPDADPTVPTGDESRPMAHDDRRADHSRHGDHAGDHRDADPTPDEALAMRRAVATIDTGSLAVRRRLASPDGELPPPPGRLIVGRDHHTAWRSSSERPTGSVFDAQPAAPELPSSDDTASVDHQERRAGALKRLIGNLRKS